MKQINTFKFLSVAILVFIFSFLDLNASHYIRNYTDKDGLSMNIGLSIVQDKQGYIWIATQDGLNRFDGANFEIFRESEGLPNNFINYLYNDKKGRLWVATREGLALHENEKFFSYTTQTGDFFKNNISCIGESMKYGLLAGTIGGLCIIKGRKLAEFPLENLLIKDKIQAITVDQHDRIYLGTPGNGIIIIDDNEVSQISKKDSLASNFVKSLLVDDEELWVGTDSGLTLLKDNKFVRTYTKENSKLSSNGINALFNDGEKSLWIATSDGLYQYQKQDEILSKHPKSDLLAGNRILSVFKDKAGDLWIGAYGGVSHLGKSKFITCSKEDGLPSNSVFGIYSADDGKLWVATYGGVVVIDESDNITQTFTTRDELPSNSVITIAGDREGNIWIGTYEGGLVRYSDGKFKVFDQKDGLPNNNVRIVYVDPKDNLWLAVDKEGLILFDKNKKNDYITLHYNTESNPRLISDDVRTIYDDELGNLWVGLDEGLCKFTDIKSNKEKPKEYLKGHYISGILKDKDRDGYWITTFDDGIYFLNENLSGSKMLTRYSDRVNFPNNNLYGIVKDKNGWLWLPTNSGILRFNPQTEKFDHYTINDGLPANENNAYGGIMDKKERIWFSTHKGIARIKPYDILINETPPSVYIEQLEVDKKPIDLHGGIQISLDPNPQNVYIKFTALSYQFPEGVKFKIRLDGFHKPDEWFEPLGNIRFAEYTNLSPGDYTFKVKAANSDGIWNEEGASLAFTINPSFFQTVWFYVTLLIVILAFIAGCIQYRTDQQRRRQKELKQRVEERTRELKETQVQLIQQGKMASLGEMAAGLAHEMNNPANYIYGNIDFLQKFIKDIESVLAEYMKLDLPEDHKIKKIREELDIDKKLEELGGLVKYVKEGATRISDIVRDLRFFVGKDEPELQKIDIHKNIETTLNLLHNKTKDRIKIRKEFGNIPEIKGSSSQLNQVFMNILSNAADAIPEEGIITIETKMKDNNNLIIKISDTGEGISLENQTRIFDPFFTTRTKEQGMGLGLSISKKVIEKHNGTIEVDSHVGEGTTFTVTLPIKSKRPRKKMKKIIRKGG